MFVCVCLCVFFFKKHGYMRHTTFCSKYEGDLEGLGDFESSCVKPSSPGGPFHITFRVFRNVEMY